MLLHCDVCNVVNDGVDIFDTYYDGPGGNCICREVKAWWDFENSLILDSYFFFLPFFLHKPKSVINLEKHVFYVTFWLKII